MGIKPKTSFRHCIPILCSRWFAVLATHIPRLPKKKPLRGKKVGFAEKKLRLWQKMAHRVYQGWHIPTYDSCLNRPSEAYGFGCCGLQSALQASPFACMELLTIRHLRWQVCSSLWLWLSPSCARLRLACMELLTICHLRWQGLLFNLTMSLELK